MPSLVWLDRDLRVRGNPALHAAAEDPNGVVPVFVWAPEALAAWAPGAASRWWLHHSLAHLQDRLADHGLELVLAHGDPARQLARLAKQADADRVHWTRGYAPPEARRDQHVRSTLEEAGLGVSVHEGRILHDPEAIETTSGGPYRVFTPFWDRFQAEVRVPRPRGAPDPLQAPDSVPDGCRLDELGLLPEPDWAHGLRETWTPGETGARRRLSRFVDEALDAYPGHRDVPGVEGTSRLSPHLAWGEIGPREVWWQVKDAMLDAEVDPEAARSFLRQVGWREFGYHLLHHFPETTTRPLREKYERLAWRDVPDELERWRRGRTGFPLVDAGLRQLWHEGWIHNRVRMVVGAFLAKHLLVPWQEGAEWFWDTLVDADLANNTLGWQWAAGCGADAQPFFRMFNPMTQGEDHDPDGVYVRRWVPELADLPDEYLNRPWEAPPEVLRAAGVELGEDYPEPIVDHGEARARAQAAYDRLG
jgi:deoxyribodipyrimidine photo-lyase